MSMLRTLMSLAITTLLVELAMAANYTVGGSNGGWDTSTNLQSWASSQSFSVGDNLIFAYSPNHDVVEVTKADYDSCQASNPLQTYTGGSTVIPLTSPGKRYFICGITGHCSQGMKVEIDTLATAAPPPATPPTPPPTSPVTPVSSPPPETAPISAPTMSPPSKSPVGSPKAETRAPAYSPTSAPEMSPPSKAAVGSPASSPSIAESPANSPSVSSPPPPSSASTVDVLAVFTVGFGFAMTMLLTL